MSRVDLTKMAVSDLVDRFAAIGARQDQAIFDDDNALYSRLFWQMEAVEQELKVRDGDQRRALLPLFNHQNMQVRLAAAKATLAVAPAAARHQLRVIADSGWPLQAGDAGMSLWNLNRGVFKPT
jgi:hypothetical protein